MAEQELITAMRDRGTDLGADPGEVLEDVLDADGLLAMRLADLVHGHVAGEGVGGGRDAFASEHLADEAAEFGFLERRQPGLEFEYRDLDAEPVPQLGLFESDGVAAEHDHRRGQAVEFHRGGRGQESRLGEPADRRRPRRRTGGVMTYSVERIRRCYSSIRPSGYIMS